MVSLTELAEHLETVPNEGAVTVRGADIRDNTSIGFGVAELFLAIPASGVNDQNLPEITERAHLTLLGEAGVKIWLGNLVDMGLLERSGRTYSVSDAAKAADYIPYEAERYKPRGVPQSETVQYLKDSGLLIVT
jgi:hypothetical protein